MYILEITTHYLVLSPCSSCRGYPMRRWRRWRLVLSWAASLGLRPWAGHLRAQRMALRWCSRLFTNMVKNPMRISMFDILWLTIKKTDPYDWYDAQNWVSPFQKPQVSTLKCSNFGWFGSIPTLSYPPYAVYIYNVFCVVLMLTRSFLCLLCKSPGTRSSKWNCVFWCEETNVD